MGVIIIHSKYSNGPVGFNAGISTERFPKGLRLISVGGNALDNSKDKKLPFLEQQIVAQNNMKHIFNQYLSGFLTAIMHGNGPQVGMLQTSTGASLLASSKISQHLIGNMIETGLSHWAKISGIKDFRAKVIPTEVLVDQNDPEFKLPTKFVGSFMTEEQMKATKEINPDWEFKYVEGKEPNSFRRVVPSPVPIKILQLEEIMYYMSLGYCTISVGGGGVPVIDRGASSFIELGHQGVDAVIDKDYASARLAMSLIQAGFPKEQLNSFVIATEVDRVTHNFGKPDAHELPMLEVHEALGYLRSGQFPDGSMGPKVRAVLSTWSKNIPSYIVNLIKLNDLESGTFVSGAFIHDDLPANFNTHGTDVLADLVAFGRKPK